MRIHLDHQTSTPLLPEVVRALRPLLDQIPGHPASLHQSGLAAREAIAHARHQIATLLNARTPEELIFTSGPTESLNLAVQGLAAALHARGDTGRILTTPIEHPAILSTLTHLESQGTPVLRLPVDATGRLDPATLQAALQQEPALFVVTHLANHELGTLQPAQTFSELTRAAGSHLVLDATHAAGWIPIDVQALDTALLAINPAHHHGPPGIGILHRRRGTPLHPLFHGGEPDPGPRPGFQNLPAVIGAGIAAECALRDLLPRADRIRSLQRQLLAGLEERITYFRINGPPPGPDRLPTHLSIAIEFIEGEGLVLAADLVGLALASGTACVARRRHISPVLEAVGTPVQLAQGTVLATLGTQTTAEDIHETVTRLSTIVTRLRSVSPAWEDFEKGDLESVILPRDAFTDTPEVAALRLHYSSGKKRSLPGLTG